MSTIVDVTPVAIAEFDYEQLDSEDRIVIQQRTTEIKAIMRRCAQDTIELGEKLAEVRDRLKHNKTGGFRGWLEVEFGWSHVTAYKYISAWEAFGANCKPGLQLDIAPQALYMLSSDRVPEEVRTEAIAIAETGQKVTSSEAEALIAKYAPPPPQPEANLTPTFTPPATEPVEQADNEATPATYLQAAPPPPKKPSKTNELQGLQHINAIEQIRIDELEKLVKELDDCLQQALDWCGNSLPGEIVGEASKLHRERLEMIG